MSRPVRDDTPFAVRIFDVDSRREGTPLPVPEGTSIFGLTFSPDGRRLVGLGSVGGPAKVIVWSVEGGNRLFAADAGIKGQLIGGDESRFAWAPDGSRFACSKSGENGTAITVHDASTGKPLVTMDRPLPGQTMFGVAPSIAFSPDGKRIAGYLPDLLIGGKPHLRVWDAASGKGCCRFDVLAWQLLRDQVPDTGDGHRLVLTEQATDSPQFRRPARPEFGSKTLLVTTCDATPVPGRETVTMTDVTRLLGGTAATDMRPQNCSRSYPSCGSWLRQTRPRAPGQTLVRRLYEAYSTDRRATIRRPRSLLHRCGRGDSSDLVEQARRRRAPRAGNGTGKHSTQTASPPPLLTMNSSPFTRRSTGWRRGTLRKPSW